MYILNVGDVHYGVKNPKSRLDDYAAAIRLKLIEISQIAESFKVEAIVFSGDIFDQPVLPLKDFIGFFRLFDNLFKDFEVFIVPGNHDIFGYNIHTLERTSVYLLSICSKNIKFILEGDCFSLDHFCLTGSPYSNNIDVDNYGYNVKKLHKDKLLVHTVHGMLLPAEPIFERYTLIKDIETEADIVIAGHYHPGWKQQTVNGTTFVNNGAICRRDASTKEIEREVYVTVIHKSGAVKPIKLKSALPGNDVLTREHLEKDENLKDIHEFHKTLKAEKLNKEFVNVNDMVTFVGKNNNVDKEVIDHALVKIEEKQLEISEKKGKL